MARVNLHLGRTWEYFAKRCRSVLPLLLAHYGNKTPIRPGECIRSDWRYMRAAFREGHRERSRPTTGFVLRSHYG